MAWQRKHIALHVLPHRVLGCTDIPALDLIVALFYPQSVKEGSPAHPSYPAGHAVQNGAFATILKVSSICHSHEGRFAGGGTKTIQG